MFPPNSNIQSSKGSIFRYDCLWMVSSDFAMDIINEMYDHCDFNEICKFYDFVLYNK